ncbi:hypothetical protein EsH8_V_000538 [Colletotrichum jinshuiense]
MYLITKILHICVILHVAFQGASGAILRGRTPDADPAQLPANDLQTLSQAAEDLDNKLDSFLRNWNGGHRKPNIVEIANIAKRQAGSIEVSQEELQELLDLIQSIGRQLAAIIASGGNSPSGSAAPSPSSTVSISGPISSSPAESIIQPTATGSGPTIPDVSPPIPSPFLTSSGVGTGGPLTTEYATSVTTGTRCKTTVTRTFTEYVYEDGSSAVARVVRSVVETDGEETTSSISTIQRDLEPEDEWEPWVEFDASTTTDEVLESGMSAADSWPALKASRREPESFPGDSGLLFARDEEK